MYEIDTKDILDAQNNSEEALSKIIEANSRISMEHCKKILRKRPINRRFIPNRLYRINKSNKKVWY